MTCVVVDSNAIKIFQDERIQDLPGIGTAAVNHIFARGHIVLDDKNHCLHEWLSCAEGPIALNLRDWVAEQQVMGKIAVVEVAPFPELSKKLRALGVPQKDVKWFRLCRASNAAALISEDSDFYHPPSKRWPGHKKEEIKEKRKGSVCDFVRREIGTEVMRLKHVVILI